MKLLKVECLPDCQSEGVFVCMNINVSECLCDVYVNVKESKVREQERLEHEVYCVCCCWINVTLGVCFKCVAVNQSGSVTV